jgi:hypothetical protein
MHQCSIPRLLAFAIENYTSQQQLQQWIKKVRPRSSIPVHNTSVLDPALAFVIENPLLVSLSEASVQVTL